MNKIYARYRVYKKWFLFNDVKLRYVIQKAEELKMEIESSENYLSETDLAERL
jgi:hypothetical protein